MTGMTTDLDWILSLSENLNFFGSVVIILTTVVLLAICYYGCQVYHAVMADNENSQHILLNIAYQHFAYCLQIGAFIYAAKVVQLILEKSSQGSLVSCVLTKAILYFNYSAPTCLPLLAFSYMIRKCKQGNDSLLVKLNFIVFNVFNFRKISIGVFHCPGIRGLHHLDSSYLLS